MARTQVWFVVVRHVVNVVFLQKGGIEDPRGFRDDLIHPATMTDGFTTLCVLHDALEFMLLYLLVAIHANEEVHVRESQFGLAKLQ